MAYGCLILITLARTMHGTFEKFRHNMSRIVELHVKNTALINKGIIIPKRLSLDFQLPVR